MTAELIPNEQLRRYQVFPLEGGKIGLRNPETNEILRLYPSEALDLYIKSYTDPATGRIMLDRHQALSLLLTSLFSTITRRGLSPDNTDFYDEYPKVQPRLKALGEIASGSEDIPVDFNVVLEKHSVAFK